MHTLPVTSSSSAFNSSSGTSPRAWSFSISCIMDWTPSLGNWLVGRLARISGNLINTHALPITPHASLASVPFSFSREKNPGLENEISQAPNPAIPGPYIPRNFFDFKNEVAFIIYTDPIVCRSYKQLFVNDSSGTHERDEPQHRNSQVSCLQLPSSSSLRTPGSPGRSSLRDAGHRRTVATSR